MCHKNRGDMENFVVSARKYRPATFRSVVGQSHITSTLKNAIARGQLAHAYLFCGPRGVGKTTCARIFAKAINCMHPIEQEACEQCESCRSFAEGRSFNIHELDAASNNSVDDIRNLTEQVRVPPQIGKYSVYIIDEVHMLSAAAFNAFLKTLEEPPAHAIFILATTEKHKIIPTILSRCQIFDFNRIKVEDGVQYMKYIAEQEGVTFDDESLNLIARKADGGMRDALSMFDKAVSFCGNNLNYKDVARSLNVLDYDTYFEAVNSFTGGDYTSALLLFDRVLTQGFSAQIFMAGLSAHMRDLLVCKNPQTEMLLDVTGSLMSKYRQQAAGIETGFLFEAINLLTQLDGQIKTSSNQRLLVELGIMKLCGLGQKKNSDPDTLALPTLKKPDPAQTAFSKTQPSAESNVQSKSAVPQPSERPDIQSKSTVSQRIESPSGTSEKQSPDTTNQTYATPTAANTHTAPGPAVQSEARPAAASSRISLGGKSLSEIMAGAVNPTQGPKQEQAAEEQKTDENAQSKIEAAKERFIARLNSERPRLAAAFESSEIKGNTLTVKVSSADLKEEIQKAWTDIAEILRDTAGTTGHVELDVVVDTAQKAARPLKPEEKLIYFTKKNPQFTELRKTLDLDAE